MKNKILRTLIPCVLIVVFVAVGVLMMVLRSNRLDYYTNEIASAQQAAADAAAAAAEAESGALAQLQEENRTMEQSIADLEQENAALDAEAERLQQEYDTLAQNEDNQYYLTIIESLTEGMKQVEQYINEAQ